ncbi:outer membrane lipoprotein carrier protein LolA [Streptomyces sp. NPDC020983]|uniref:outer membrane lipoprotein carrier protein LolA n=1 Tax=Streptomyces sp. NPDC020983 TaxID=3365106 RepID=UPI0037B496FC
MALIQPAQPEQPEEYGYGGGRRSRKALRYAVPAALVGVTAATVSLVPALADSGDPSLPKLTAEQVLTKIAASDTQTVDGTVTFTTDLGLPSALSATTGSSLFGGAAAPPSLGSPDASRAEPQRQFVQLLVGSHTLHVSADGPDRQKVSIIQPAAEYSVIHNGTQVWAYDSSSNEAYHATMPAHEAPAAKDRTLPEDFPATPQDAARQILQAARGKATITTDGTARVAGHSAYVLVVRPQHASGTTIGAARIAVDAKTGVPLRFSLDAASGGKPIVEVGYTRVSFARPAAGTFDFTPGKGVKVTEGGTATGGEHAPGLSPGMASGAPTFVGSGWDTVAVFRTKGALPPGAPHNEAGTAGKAWKGAEGRDSRKGGHDGGPADVGSLLSGFGKHVTGSFGSGTLFHTRLVNVLLTDDGTVYAGAVTQSALEAAANAAAG